MEVVLKIRVPRDFDGPMEEMIDRALADVLYDMGCELVDSKEYKDVEAQTQMPQFRHFGLEDMRALIQEEIALNGVAIYGMTAEEAVAMQRDVDSVDMLAEYMDRAMYRVDGNEHRALEIVFEQNFSDVLDDFRETRVAALVNNLGLDYMTEVDGRTIFVDCWWGDSVEIFLADDGGLMCMLPDEDEPRALRDRIQDVKPGDAFFLGDGGIIRTTSDGAFQNFGYPGDPWVVIGDDNEVYHEHQIGSAIGHKMKELLEKLPVRVQTGLEPDEYPVEYPLRNYDDAVGHLCEALNTIDWELDSDDVRTPIETKDFIPIFKSENYFGIYVWHGDRYYEGCNEYYLVNRNNGEHTMVLGDSFEFVGKNLLDCMKEEKILHVANTEWLRYLVDFSLQNVQGVVPEQELRGIAVLEAALREAVKNEGKYMLGPSLMERLDAAKRDSIARGESGKRQEPREGEIEF